jgi:hypothetical protein
VCDGDGDFKDRGHDPGRCRAGSRRRDVGDRSSWPGSDKNERAGDVAGSARDRARRPGAVESRRAWLRRITPGLVASLVLCLLRPAASASPRLSVDLVFDGPPMPSRLEGSAMEEVTRIWAPYGVDVHVSSPTAAGREGAVKLTVVLAELSGRRTATDVLGSIRFLDDVPEPGIVMYPNEIHRLVSTGRLYDRNEREWPAAFRHLILGRVLGRALAHEIGHFLLRSPHHSRVGLMRSEQALPDLVAPDRHLFVLSADEAARFASIARTDYSDPRSQ